MIEFLVNEAQYRAANIPALEKGKLIKKVAPLFASALPAIFAAARDSEDGLSDDEVVAVLIPAFSALNALSDADLEAIVYTTLSYVQKRVGDAWTPVSSVSNKAILFPDIKDDFEVMFEIVRKVLVHNLAPFFEKALGKAAAEVASQQKVAA